MKSAGSLSKDMPNNDSGPNDNTQTQPKIWDNLHHIEAWEIPKKPQRRIKLHLESKKIKSNSKIQTL